MVEGAPHRAKRSRDQLLCLWGAPSSVYKGGEGERAGQGEDARPRGAILHQVGFPLFPSPRRRGKEGVREGKGKGAPPLPLPCPIRTRGEGARGLPWLALLFSLTAH